MLTITVGMNPNLVTIGSLVIAWHGLLTAVAVLAAIIVTARLAKSVGLTPDNVYSVALWAVPGGVVGSRIPPVIENLDYFVAHPGSIFAIWEGGVSLWGALLGGALTAIVAARIQRIPMAPLFDASAPGMILAQAIGRIGCIINGDAWGTPTFLPWGFVYTHPDAASTTILWESRHPAPVYEIFYDLFVLGILLILRRKSLPRGALFFIYFSVYAFGRFFISFVRGEPQVLGILHQAHIISLLTLAVTVPLLIYVFARKRKPAPGSTEPQDQPQAS